MKTARIEDAKPGNVVLTVDDMVYIAKSPRSVHKMIKEIEKKHHKTPLITFIPRGDTLILISF